MKLTSIGTVIARRELMLAGRKKVVVEIGKPRKFRGSPDYYCPYRIRTLAHCVLRPLAPLALRMRQIFFMPSQIFLVLSLYARPNCSRAVPLRDR
jgi:hypothetical protein